MEPFLCEVLGISEGWLGLSQLCSKKVHAFWQCYRFALLYFKICWWCQAFMPNFRIMFYVIFFIWVYCSTGAWKDWKWSKMLSKFGTQLFIVAGFLKVRMKMTFVHWNCCNPLNKSNSMQNASQECMMHNQAEKCAHSASIMLCAITVLKCWKYCAGLVLVLSTGNHTGWFCTSLSIQGSFPSKFACCVTWLPRLAVV